MAHRKSITKKEVDKRVAAGRGDVEKCGCDDYKPFYDSMDISVHGKRFEIRDPFTGITHHGRSALEAKIIILLSWLRPARICTQIYLDRLRTDAIYKELGYQVPTGPLPLTEDVVYSIINDHQERRFAIGAKYVRDLEEESLARNLEVRRVFWNSMNIPWTVLTERDIPLTLIREIMFLRDYYDIENHGVSRDKLEFAQKQLTEQIVTNPNGLPLNEISIALDKKLSANLDSGDSLVIAYHLIATKKWRLDLQAHTQLAFKVLNLQSVSEDLL